MHQQGWDTSLQQGAKFQDSYDRWQANPAYAVPAADIYNSTGMFPRDTLPPHGNNMGPAASSNLWQEHPEANFTDQWEQAQMHDRRDMPSPWQGYHYGSQLHPDSGQLRLQ